MLPGTQIVTDVNNVLALDWLGPEVTATGRTFAAAVGDVPVDPTSEPLPPHAASKNERAAAAPPEIPRPRRINAALPMKNRRAWTAASKRVGERSHVSARLYHQAILLELQMRVAGSVRLGTRRIHLEILPQGLTQIRHGGPAPGDCEHQTIEIRELMHHDARGGREFMHAVATSLNHLNGTLQLTAVELDARLRLAQSRAGDGRQQRECRRRNGDDGGECGFRADRHARVFHLALRLKVAHWFMKSIVIVIPPAERFVDGRQGFAKPQHEQPRLHCVMMADSSRTEVREMKLLSRIVCLTLAVGLSSCLFQLKYTVGGTVTGLRGSGLVLDNNSGDSLAISANGAFVFSSSVTKSGAYSVTVATQPTDPVQTCTVSNGSGTIDGDVGNVVVSCSQQGQFAYVANQTDNTISAYTIDTSGLLTPVAGSPFPTGTKPTSLIVDPNGAFLYVANNGSADVSVYSINTANGALLSAGLPLAAGNGPAALTIDPRNHLFVANQTDGTVSVFTIASTGLATTVSGSPFSVGAAPFSVKTDPNGNFLYVVNSSGNDVTVLAIDSATGSLTPIAGSPFGAAPDRYRSPSIPPARSRTLRTKRRHRSRCIASTPGTAS